MKVHGVSRKGLGVRKSLALSFTRQSQTEPDSCPILRLMIGPKSFFKRGDDDDVV